MTRNAADRFLRPIPAGAVSAAALLVVVVVLWLPFGFNIGFSGDDWFFYMNARSGIAWAELSRPFLPFAYVLGYALAPGYFAGFNYMMIILLFARSWLTYRILLRLGSGQVLAFAVGLLTAVVPADTGVFYMGALNVYFAWDAYLLALYCLIVYWRRLRLAVLLLMWGALIVNLGTYEAAYPLIVVSPVVLLLLPKRSRRQWTGVLFRWYIFPALNAVRLFALILINPSNIHYQSGLIEQTPTIGSMLSSLVNIYARHFASGWFGGGLNPGYVLIGLAVGLLAALAIWWLARRGELPALSFTRWAALAGLLIVGLGVALLLPTRLSVDTTRTFFISSLGAALAIVALAWLVTRRAVFFALVVGVFVAAGSAQLLEQHRQYTVNTKAQQGVLLTLVSQVPHIKPNSALLVMDETPERDLEQKFPGRWSFQNPVLLAYDDLSLAVGLCYPADSSESVDGYCKFDRDSVEVRISPLVTWTRSYSEVVMVRYTANHEFVLAKDLAPYGNSPAYQPEALIDSKQPLSEATITLLKPE